MDLKHCIISKNLICVQLCEMCVYEDFFKLPPSPPLDLDFMLCFFSWCSGERDGAARRAGVSIHSVNIHHITRTSVTEKTRKNININININNAAERKQ